MLHIILHILAGIGFVVTTGLILWGLFWLIDEVKAAAKQLFLKAPRWLQETLFWVKIAFQVVILLAGTYLIGRLFTEAFIVLIS